LKDEPNGPHQKPWVNPGAREGYAVPVSYKTAAMLYSNTHIINTYWTALYTIDT